MQGRFTIIQGGLAGQEASPPRTRGANASRWRVVLRRPGDLAQDELAAWRRLAEAGTPVEAFADPDLLVPAAQHSGIGPALVFALVHAETGTGETLVGVAPLVPPRRLRDGPAFRVWKPSSLPRPAFLLDGDGIGAILAYLRPLSSRACLRVEGLDGAHPLLHALATDERFRIDTRERPAPVPGDRFVDLNPAAPASDIEHVVGAPDIRDAVERFLYIEAHHAQVPVLADPAASTALRVATRLLATRGRVCVELGHRDGRLVGGAIRIGALGQRVTWHATGPFTSPQPIRTRDAEIGLAKASGRTGRSARLHLVGRA